MKPRIFIGSSVEGLDIAHLIQVALEHDFEPVVWTQGVFELTKTSLESLMKASCNFSFAIFVVSKDDMTVMRRTERHVARDNVIFELGLFIGKLSRECVFVVSPRGPEFAVSFPTDLLGITVADYDPSRTDGNLEAALGPACTKIKNAIRKAASTEVTTAVESSETLFSGDDAEVKLLSWFSRRTVLESRQEIQFATIDRQLGLKPGSTKTQIQSVAAQCEYILVKGGDQCALFTRKPAEIIF